MNTELEIKENVDKALTNREQQEVQDVTKSVSGTVSKTNGNSSLERGKDTYFAKTSDQFKTQDQS